MYCERMDYPIGVIVLIDIRVVSSLLEMEVVIHCTH